MRQKYKYLLLFLLEDSIDDKERDIDTMEQDRKEWDWLLDDKKRDHAEYLKLLERFDDKLVMNQDPCTLISLANRLNEKTTTSMRKELISEIGGLR